MMQQLAAQQEQLRQQAESARTPETVGADAAGAAVASAAVAATGSAVAGFDENDPATWGDPGRNDACPCGSGKKFKHCHGRI